MVKKRFDLVVKVYSEGFKKCRAVPLTLALLNLLKGKV
jgi:hypothetical protein